LHSQGIAEGSQARENATLTSLQAYVVLVYGSWYEKQHAYVYLHIRRNAVPSLAKLSVIRQLITNDL
jgi:hypothetical protein